MAHALELAREAESRGEVPVGAVIVRDGVELPPMRVQLGEVGQIERGVSQ